MHACAKTAMHMGQRAKKALPNYNMQDCIEEAINLKTDLRLRAQTPTAIKSAIGISTEIRLECNA